MGWLDSAKERQADMREAASVAIAGCHHPASHYQTEVNKGSVNMAMLTGKLNQQYASGYRLAHAYEQGGNTVLVFEHNHP